MTKLRSVLRWIGVGHRARAHCRIHRGEMGLHGHRLRRVHAQGGLQAEPADFPGTGCNENGA